MCYDTRMIIYQDMYYAPRSSTRRLHIYLPPGYMESDERYPVMYMFDGQNLFHNEEATYGHSWGLEWFADHWIKKIIIVGMECSHTGDERLEEYSPYDMRWKGVLHHGIGEETYQWVIQNVKAWTDQNLRTYGHREATGIGGSSMGGIMSLYGVMRHNDVFSKAACLSTGIFWHMRAFERDLNVSSISRDTRIYLGWGEKEAGRAAHGGDPAFDTREARATRKFEKELQKKGARTYLYFQKDGQHREEDWEKQDGLFMNWLWCED